MNNRNIRNSQVAGHDINKSKNDIKNISVNKIRKESAIISLIIGFVSSILASIVFQLFTSS